MPNGEKWYAVAKGKQTGIYTDWDTCKSNVDRVSNNCYKKFSSPEAAGEFIREYRDNSGSSGNSGGGSKGNGNAK